MPKEVDLNVLGQPLVPCSFDPLTGFFRDGCCKTDDNDLGRHLVCAIVTKEFLQFSLKKVMTLLPQDPNLPFLAYYQAINGAYALTVGLKHMKPIVRLKLSWRVPTLAPLKLSPFKR